MLIFLTTLLASWASIFRSRAPLGLETLALRHQVGVLHRSAGKRPKLTAGDRLLWICLARLALAVGHRQARNGRRLASCRLSLVLDLQGALPKTRTTRHFKRSSRSDSQDIREKFRLAFTKDQRRTIKTRHRIRRVHCRIAQT